jgi:phospholipid/cholesterol/gamma-HCH transport system permease protein
MKLLIQNTLFEIGSNVIRMQREFKLIRNYLTQIFLEIFKPPFRNRELLAHINFFAFESMPVILICVSFAAMVTLLESSFHMKLVIGDDSLVPGFAALLILRELGAMITGLLLTARVGASITAEIANQKISDQIEALHMIGVRPINYLVVPRFLLGLLVVDSQLYWPI